jgi:predicted nucleic acid-binding protein
VSRIAVVDTSVVAKWFFDEPHARQAHRLLGDEWELRNAAFELACRHRRGIYDALFVAVALLLGAKLVTADRRLHDALADQPGVGDALLWIEDLPATG